MITPRSRVFFGSVLALSIAACAPESSTGGGSGTAGASGAGSPGAGGALGVGGSSGGSVGPGSGGSGNVSGAAGGPAGDAGSTGATGTGGSGTGARGGSGGGAGTGTGGAPTGGRGGSGGGGASGTGGTATGGRGVGGGGASGAGGMATGGRGGGAGGATGTGGTGGDPPSKTVRVFWLRPSDVPDDTKHPDGIAAVMKEAQKYYMQELGKTFKLNTPVVETVVGEHVKSWYENTANGGDKYWWSVTNMEQELTRRFKLGNPDSRWMIVGEISAEGDGAGGGGSVGWVVLCQHDADGAAGIGGTLNRWYGGMVHELGHAFGLPDAASTDGTPMSASLYDYPNTHFNQSQKNSILNGPSASWLFAP